MLDRYTAAMAARTMFQMHGQVLTGETPAQRAQRIYTIREQPEPFQPLYELAHAWRKAHNIPSPMLPWARMYVPYQQSERTARLFMAAPSTPRNLSVREAYSELSRQVESQVNLLLTLGLRFEFVNDPEPYNSAQEQMCDVVHNARIRVATIAVWPDAYHPILSNERGGSYDMFRAVHDLFGHVAIGTGFDRHGEFAAWLHHATMFHGEAQKAATTELHGENSVLAVTGKPAEHKAVILSVEIPYRHIPFY